jgi:hypothetical protein
MFACLLLAGCGGGGGGSAAPAVPIGSSGTNPSTPSSKALAPATLSVSFLQYTPVQTSAHRRAQFLSPATQSIVLTLVSVNGAAPSSAVTATVNVGANASGCTTTGVKVTCTASFNAPVGNDVLSAVSYSGPSGTGTTLGTASVPATIQSNATNAVALDIGGVIANLQLYLATSSFTLGTAATSLIVVVPLDSSGAQIVNPGNYATPIAISETGNSSFSLLVDGASSGTSATLASPNDQLALSYSGATTGATTITATAGSGVTASVSASANTPALASSIHGNTSSTPDHFAFTALGQTGTLTVSGGTPPYTVTSSDPTVASVSGSGTSYTITATGYGTNGLGTATLTITDSASPTPATRTESVTVVPATITATPLSCGTADACTASGITFAAGASSNLGATYTLGGGILSYSYAFVSSGTTMSQDAAATIAGSTLTITPNGAGSDTLILTSGSQTAVLGINAAAPTSASYAIASTAHAYAPSAGTLTMSHNASEPATATLTTSIGSAPWTVTSSNPSVVTVTPSQSGYVLTSAGTGTATITLTPATGTAPTPLAVTVIPMLAVSPASQLFGADGDAFSVTVSNGTSGGLTIAANSISASPSGIVSLTGFSSATLRGTTASTGATTITFHDTNVDRKVSATIAVTTSDLSTLENALGAYGQTAALGLRASTPATISGLPTWITGVSATNTTSGGLSGAVSYASQSLSVPSTPASNGTLQFTDALGGSVPLAYAVLRFTFGDPGASIGAIADEALTAVGQTDAVAVSDGTSGHAYTATSSNPSVVTASGGTDTVSLAAVSSGVATITVVDTSIAGNPSTTFTVSVTTTTIPVDGKARR